MQRSAGLFFILALVLAMAKMVGNGSGPVISPAPAEVEEKESQKETERPDEIGLPLLSGFALGNEERLELDFLLATLPDPELTRLDWTFDSHLDALRRAFEAAGFVLDRFRMPTGAGSPKSSPGALLFVRRTPESVRVVLVYLVGELPTRGIDDVAFSAALAERKRIRKTPPHPCTFLHDKHILKILGPTFSGSADSLRTALEISAGLLEGTESIRVVSGAATGGSNFEKIALGTRVGRARVTFETTLHTDHSLKQVLVDELLPRLGLECSEVAILSESNTSYGQALNAEESELCNMLQIPFPMSIHALRRAYDENGQLARQDFAPPGRYAATRIPLDMSDAKAEELQTTSELTPASIDLLLEETTRILEQRRIRAVLLFATDVRDKLFLGCELKNRLPDLQLFTTEGNVLYVRPELNRWLRGMVVLSTYPIMLGDGRAPSSSNEEYLFASEGAAGTFNATLTLLARNDLVHDYAHQVGDHTEHRPPVIVSAVGAGTMLPIRSFQPGTEAWAPTSLPGSKPAASSVAEPVRLGVVAIFAFACWLAIHLWGARRRAPWIDHLLHRGNKEDAPIEDRHRTSLALQHELYWLCQHSALWSILLPNSALMIGTAVSPPQQWLTYVCALASLSVSVVGACVLGQRWVRWQRDWWKLDMARVDYYPERKSVGTMQVASWKLERVMRFFLALLAFLYLVWSLFLSCRMASFLIDEQEGSFTPFLRRSVGVDQGLSFLLPTLLIGLILVLWCGWHRQRLAALVASPCVETPLERWLGEESELVSRLRRRIFRVIPSHSVTPYTIPVLLILVWLAMRIERPIDDLFLGWQDARWQKYLESPFGTILRCGIVGTFAASAWAVVRLITIWHAFTKLLGGLGHRDDLLPDASQLERIGKTIDLSLLPTDSNARLRDHRKESWSRLRTLASSPSLRSLGAKSMLDSPADADDLQRERHQNALKLLEAHASTDHERDRELVRDVLVAEVLLYVDWALEHCRRLAWFLVGAIVLTTALVWSYPIQPQSIVQLASFAVFTAAAVALLWFAAAANRNPTLSRIAGTTPGSLTWDRSLVVNLLLFVLVPFASLLTSQAPELRQVVVDTLRSMLGGLTTG